MTPSNRTLAWRCGPLLLCLVAHGCGTSDDSGGESSHFCCTAQRFCENCPCDIDERTIADSQDEHACQQLLDSTDLSCPALGSTAALASCVQAAPDSTAS